MKFQETFDFDYPADLILRVFGDKGYYLEKYRTMGADAPEVLDSKAEGQTFSISVRHALDASRLSFPDFIKKRIGNKLYLRQTDTWRLDRASGRVDTVIEKMPVEIFIDMRLADRDGGSEMTLGFDIKASIPLVGGRIEKAVAGPISRITRKDLLLTNRMAADYV